MKKTSKTGWLMCTNHGLHLHYCVWDEVNEVWYCFCNKCGARRTEKEV